MYLETSREGRPQASPRANFVSFEDSFGGQFRADFTWLIVIIVNRPDSGPSARNGGHGALRALHSASDAGALDATDAGALDATDAMHADARSTHR